MKRLEAALADRYALERELGRGGMATVYLAHDLRHDRPVALKVLRPELAASLGPSASFARSGSAPACSIPTSSPCSTADRRAGEGRGGPALVHHAVRRGRDAPRAGSPARASSRSADALRIAREVADGARLCPPARRDPPRHQAGEHPARPAATRWSPTSASRGRWRRTKPRRGPADRDRHVRSARRTT